MKVLEPEETLVLLGVQDPAYNSVPASVEEKESEGVLLVEEAVIVETPVTVGGVCRLNVCVE